MEFVNYRKFYDEEQANELASQLKVLDIPMEIVASKDDLNFIYGDKTFKNQFIVNLLQRDFEKADALLLRVSAVQLESVSKDHYLFAFTDEELFDLLSKPDEWSELDYQLAQKILHQRGKEINSSTIELLKKQRISELAKPEESPNAWVYAAYLFALLGGILGTFMGYFMMTSKKTLPNGEKVPTYTPRVRQHGLYIMIIGIIFGIIHFILFLNRD